jgi:vacuolar protein sorting-associated protein 33A
MFVCTAQEWDPKDAAPQPTPEIDTLVLLDRSVDTVTPLVTPLTYEGLINELIGITNGYVKLDADVAEGGETGAPGGSSGASPQPLEQQQQRKKLVAVPLNSNDALYAKIRDLNVEQLGPFLQEKVRSPQTTSSTYTMMCYIPSVSSILTQHGRLSSQRFAS